MSESKIRPIVTRSVSLTNEDKWANEIHPVLRRIYNARGIITEEELDYSLRKILPVSTLTGVNDAVQLVLKHKNKRIIIIGDFDADGDDDGHDHGDVGNKEDASLSSFG